MTSKRPTVSDLKIKLFADGADKASIVSLSRNPAIAGFTTNPTLMRKSGISDYEGFARGILEVIADRPISFEVFSDDFSEMLRQGRKIASWGSNVYVKVPVTNTKGEFASEVIRSLAREGVKLNVTALMTLNQVKRVAEELDGGVPACISVFAGRVADTGIDPSPVMRDAVDYLKAYPAFELIWASPRELLNIFQADAVGCHIITATPDILKKLELVGKDLLEYSLDTVKMFHGDALAAGFTI